MSDVRLTLPDGSVRVVPRGTTGRDVARAISEGLARNALAVRHAGTVKELDRPLDADGDRPRRGSSAAPDTAGAARGDSGNARGRADRGDGRATRTTGPTRHRPGRKAGSLVVLHRGELVLYRERGGRTLLTWGGDPAVLGAANETLAGFVRRGAIGALSVQRIDGEKALGSQHPVAAALTAAGFHTTPNGYRLRR